MAYRAPIVFLKQLQEKVHTNNFKEVFYYYDCNLISKCLCVTDMKIIKSISLKVPRSLSKTGESILTYIPNNGKNILLTKVIQVKNIVR